MTNKSDCEIQFHFKDKMYCTHFYNQNVNLSTTIDYEYNKILKLLKDDTLAKLLTPNSEIKLLHVRADNTKNKSEVRKIIEYLIHNITTPILEIDIIDIGELDLSQMQPCAELLIYDRKGVLPPEYLHHLVKLLENRRTKIVRFLYNRDIPLKEDLAEFENINIQIDSLGITYARMTTYVIQLKY